MVLKKFFIGFILFIPLSFFAQKKSNVNTNTDTTKLVTIKGIVEKGVEAGCIILKTKENKVYLLLNLKTTVRFGTCIKVTGYIKENSPSVCMQGIPFLVKSYCPCYIKSRPKYMRELPKEKTMKE